MGELLTCPECVAALDCYSDQMIHEDWHRSQRARLTELEDRIDELGRATGLDDVWLQRKMEERGGE